MQVHEVPDLRQAFEAEDDVQTLAILLSELDLSSNDLLSRVISDPCVSSMSLLLSSRSIDPSVLNLAMAGYERIIRSAIRDVIESRLGDSLEALKDRVDGNIDRVMSIISSVFSEILVGVNWNYYAKGNVVAIPASGGRVVLSMYKSRWMEILKRDAPEI